MMMVDTLDMTAPPRGDRARVPRLRRVSNRRHAPVTDTMVETAAAESPGKSPPKTVVADGAIDPVRVRQLGWLFNLGSALSFAQVLPAASTSP